MRGTKTVESGEKARKRWQPTLAEDVFSSQVWRAGGAIIGTQNGIHKFETTQRVGTHRRWDADEFLQTNNVEVVLRF